MSTADPFEPATVQTAIERSVLGGLSSTLIDAVLDEAVRAEVSAGRSYSDPPLSLVVSGLFRVGVSSADGRQLTVAYMHAGDLIGLAALVGRRFPVTFQAVTDAALLRLSRGRFDELRCSQPSVAAAVSDQLVRHIDDILNELTLAGFGRVRQRIVRHLLTLAEGQPGVGGAECRITHQELADAVGAVRETVTHRVAELRAEGLLGEDRGQHLMIIPDLARLRADLTATRSARRDRSYKEL